jgi:hypothetical protein
MPNVFNYPIDYTHMPHIVKWRDKELLFLSKYNTINKNWEPYYTDWNDEIDPVYPLNLEHKSICNLFCNVYSDECLHFSYIARDSSDELQLYTTQTKDLEIFSSPEKRSLSSCWTGYVKDNLIITVYANELTIQKETITKYSFPWFDTIFRVFPHDDQSLITAIIKDRFRTYIFNHNDTNPILKEIQTRDNKNIYKSTIYQNYLIVAERASADGEESLYDRKLTYYNNFDIIPRPDIPIVLQS